MEKKLRKEISLNNEIIKKFKPEIKPKMNYVKNSIGIKIKNSNNFLPHLIDGIYNQGIKNLYVDNYSWTINTIKLLQDLNMPIGLLENIQRKTI